MSACTCKQHGDYCPEHPACLCGCPRHAHAAMGGECIAGKMTCAGCKQYRPEIGLGDEDSTPVIDEGLHARAKQIDWTPLDKWPPNVVECRRGHKEYRSHAKYDAVSSRIVSRLPCPVCGSHEMKRSSIIEATTVVTGEINGVVPAMPPPRCLHGNDWKSCPECPPRSRADIGELATILETDDEP